MTINLTKSFTVDDVKKFIALSDDSAHRQIRVTQGGIVFISDTVGAEDTKGLAFRFETLNKGNGYLGKVASENKVWVKRIHDALKKNWPNPTSKGAIEIPK